MSGTDPIRDEWFPVARASDIAAGRWLPFELLDERWVLACDSSGRVEVFVDTCPHRGARITLGDFDGERLRCGYHGWQFDIDGHCIHQPAHPDRVPAGIRLRGAAAQLGFGFWWVCAGDRPRNLPVAPDHAAHPERTVWLDPVRVESSGPRVIENFLDLAHFPFVHEGYLGQEPYTGVDPYGIEHRDDELRFTDCVVWQPDPGPAAAGGGPVRYQYSVSHPYGATLTKVPSGDEGGGAGGFTILIVASPVTETACVVWRSTVVHDTGADLDAQRAFNELIFSQDIDVVESQRPRRLPVDPRMESHQAADAGSLAYRRWLRARGIRYGTIDNDGHDDPDSDRNPRSIPTAPIREAP